MELINQEDKDYLASDDSSNLFLELLSALMILIMVCGMIEYTENR